MRLNKIKKSVFDSVRKAKSASDEELLDLCHTLKISLSVLLMEEFAKIKKLEPSYELSPPKTELKSVYYENGKTNLNDTLISFLGSYTSFCLGNVLKYVFRYEKKYLTDYNRVEGLIEGAKDLKKAINYVDFLIKYLE